jgi:hypothetical protein
VGGHSTGEDRHRTQKRRCVLYTQHLDNHGRMFSITQRDEYTTESPYAVKPPDARDISATLRSPAKLFTSSERRLPSSAIAYSRGLATIRPPRASLWRDLLRPPPSRPGSLPRRGPRPSSARSHPWSSPNASCARPPLRDKRLSPPRLSPPLRLLPPHLYSKLDFRVTEARITLL